MPPQSQIIWYEAVQIDGNIGKMPVAGSTNKLAMNDPAYLKKYIGQAREAGFMQAEDGTKIGISTRG